METERYNRISRALHWASAVVIIWASLSGFALAAMAPESTLRALVADFNVSLTTAFVPFFAWRLVHACRAPKPGAVSASRLQQRAAQIMHAALYALTTVVLGSGLLMMPADIPMFGLFSIPNIISDPAWNDVFHSLHNHGCRILGVLIVLHVGAVIAHHRAGRPVLARMRGA